MILRTTRAFSGGVKNRCRTEKCLLPLLLVLLSVQITLQAQERILPPEMASLYTVRKWTLDDGLPDSRVCGVVAGLDGYLWLATSHFLVRFYGESFEIVDMPEQAAAGVIEGLFQDSRGGLWVYGYLGVMRYQDGHWWQSEDAGVPRGRVTCVSEHPDGAVWFSRESEIREWRDGDTRCVLKASEFGGGSGVIRQLAFTADGVLWIASGDGLYRAERTGAVRKQREMDIRAEWILHARRESSALYAHGSFVCLRRGQSGWERLPESHVVSARCLLSRADGELWVGHDAGVDVFRADRWLTREQDFLTGPSRVAAMTEDHEGNIWLAASTGLVRLRRRIFAEVPVHGRPDAGIAALWAESDGRLWAGLGSGGLASGDLNGLQPMSAAPDLQSGVLRALYREQSGKMWCGGLGGGVWTLRNGAVQRLQGVFADGISAIAGDGGPPQWMATGQGLLMFNDERSRLEELAWPSDPVLALWLDRSGYLWVGHESLGLAVLRSGVRDEFLPDADLPGRTVRAIYRDSEGVFWIGGMNGLARWENDRRFVFGREHGLWNTSVRQISEDASGCLWLGTADGIMRISKRELADVAAGRRAILAVRTFGREAGLDETICTGGVCFPLGEPPRDRLWFPTDSGLFTVDTRNLPHARPAPAVRLVSLDLGESVAGADSASNSLRAVPLTEPGSSRDVSVAYTALDLTTGERARFRYALSGPVDQRSGLTEERRVRFSRLPPGRYSFRVTACNGDGVWHESGATAAWTVRPFFWETLWFRLGSLLFMGGLVTAAVRAIERRRVNRHLREAQREEELSRERARIARDLHDEIGAKLTKLSLLGTMVAEDPSSDEKLRAEIGEIAGTARETHRAFDEIVWSVSPRNDAVRSLSHYICKYAEEFFAVSDVVCRCRLPEMVPDHPLDPKKRHQVFLAVKEALNNVMKHSKATQVSIEFVFSPGGPLRIEVADNGCGFDGRSCECRGEGLRNMRERVGMIGGALKLESSEGAGTRVIIEVPV